MDDLLRDLMRLFGEMDGGDGSSREASRQQTAEKMHDRDEMFAPARAARAEEEERRRKKRELADQRTTERDRQKQREALNRSRPDLAEEWDRRSIDRFAFPDRSDTDEYFYQYLGQTGFRGAAREHLTNRTRGIGLTIERGDVVDGYYTMRLRFEPDEKDYGLSLSERRGSDQTEGTFLVDAPLDNAQMRAAVQLLNAKHTGLRFMGSQPVVLHRINPIYAGEDGKARYDADWKAFFDRCLDEGA